MKHTNPIPQWMGIFLLCLPLSHFAQSDTTAGKPISIRAETRIAAKQAAANSQSGVPSDTALFRVIRSGDVSALKQKIAAGADASATLNGFSALMIATLSGTVEEMQVLMEHGAQVNYADNDSITALWLAVPNEAKTLFLLDHGADPNMLSKEHYTPLVKLVSFPGTTPLFNKMVARGADPKRSARDNTLLYLAASTNDTALVGTLLSLGFRPNDTIAIGDYPICAALSYRGFLTVKMLVDNGADVNVATPKTFLPDLVGLTPLMLAALNDDEPSFYYLLDHGSNVNTKCKKGYTALMCLQQSETDHPALTQALLEHGALASEKTNGGVDALSLARKKGNTRSAELLQSSLK
ncbi:MAG TPA: ankyrin repeat domain-containing protein [Puia sp.]|jgi:ankyrin repeat protein|nr:ankyrin repeat domain-containing protein [Puia sp.]